jgi:hypothetical protein
MYHQDYVPFSLTGPIAAGMPAFQVPEFSWTIDNVTHSAMDNVKVCADRSLAQL